jgi:hypothetical protein
MGGEGENLIARRRRNPSAGEGVALTRSHQGGASDTRVALVFRRVLES